jgi:hypothetical protein
MGDWIRRIKGENRHVESDGCPYVGNLNHHDISSSVISRVNIATISFADGLNKYNSANIPISS